MIISVEELVNILAPRESVDISRLTKVNGFSIDTRTITRGQVYIAVEGEHKDGHNYVNEAFSRGASAIVVNRPVRLVKAMPTFIVDDTLLAIRRIIKYIIKARTPFVYGVTGAVGKTTTKEMLAYLLGYDFSVWCNQGTQNNLLGLAKTVFSLGSEDVLIAELGTNAPGEIKILADALVPNVGVITFVKPVHLQELKSVKGVFNEKRDIFTGNPKMKAVLNGDDIWLRKIEDSHQAHWFGTLAKNSVCFKRYTYAMLTRRTETETEFIVQDKYKLRLKTPFAGFIYNALAAVVSAKLKGFSIKRAVEILSDFKSFVPARMEIIERNGIKIINDAYNANPYSFKTALNMIRSMPGNKIVVAGDMLELGSRSVYYHEALAQDIVRSKARFCFAVGELTPYLVKRLEVLGFKGARHFRSVNEIGRYLHEICRAGDLILLKGSRRIGLENIIRFF